MNFIKTSLLIAIALTTFPVFVKGQACPACSNPALQSSEKLEAGLDTLYKGAFRVTFNLTNGNNYQGGHPNRRGLNENGQIVNTPLHYHNVSLDFVRSELSLEYTLKMNWSVWLRVPYDIKKQVASIDFTDPVTESEKQYILDNRDLHHRNETYYDFSDLRFLVARRVNGFLGENGRLDIAIGSSVPVGATEANPLNAGENGLKHLHIQFGSGTFDPLFEVHYASALSEKVSLAAYSINRFSFYKNEYGYRGPVETTSGISLGYRLKNWLTARGTFANFSQGYAKWDDENDPNSGLISFNGNVGLTFTTSGGLLLSPGYRFPISQSTLSDEGDTFEYGATFLFSASYLF